MKFVCGKDYAEMSVKAAEIIVRFFDKEIQA